MSPSDFPPPLPELDQFHETHFPELVAIGTSQFAMPAADAEELAQEVMLAALCRIPPLPANVADRRTWLHAAMRTAARTMTGRAG